MASHKFSSLKMPDCDLVDAFTAVAPMVPQLAAASLTLQLSDSGGAFDMRMTDVATNPAVAELRAARSTLVHRASMSGGGYALSVTRGAGSDEVAVTFPDNQQPDVQIRTIKLLATVHEQFQAYGRTAATDEVLGKELAEFYRQREELLTRFERLHAEIMESNEEYRRRLDERTAQDRDRLLTEYQKKSDELEAAYVKKDRGLAEREAALEAKIATLEDRSSTHERREVRKEMKKVVAERTASFQLSRTTVQKRRPVHALFIALISTSGALFALALLGYLPVPATLPAWFTAFRLPLLGIAFATAVVFYIRWADDWFRQHADEEMRLKRLELDLDRATWVVEMSLEWQREKSATIPEELIERLSRNLFESDRYAKPRHPGEDLASALLGASSGLSLQIPGLGEAKFDRKGIRQFKDAVSKADDA